MTACVYKATNILNGHTYIGKTINFTRRINEHKNHAKKDGGAFHKAILEYGFDSFVFEIIEECAPEDLNQREIYYIEKIRNEIGQDKVYNICKGGDGGQTHDISGSNNPMYGRRYTPEEKAMISERGKGRIVSDETRANLSRALSGKPKSKEAVAKISHPISVENIYTGEVIVFPSKSEMNRVLHCNTCTIMGGKTTKSGWKLFEQKDVSTNGDECNHVGSEISTDSKREAVEK